MNVGIHHIYIYIYIYSQYKVRYCTVYILAANFHHRDRTNEIIWLTRSWSWHLAAEMYTIMQIFCWLLHIQCWCDGAMQSFFLGYISKYIHKLRNNVSCTLCSCHGFKSLLYKICIMAYYVLSYMLSWQLFERSNFDGGFYNIEMLVRKCRLKL